MKLRSGNAASLLVEFPSGPPDGDIDWTVLGPTGATLDSGSLSVSDDAVSATITVPGDTNTLTGEGLISYRDLVWTYTVGGTVINGEKRYTIEGRVPFGVSPDGVRNLLGAEPHDVPDDDIDLVKAYYDFAQLVAGSAFPVLPDDDISEIRVREALEALAALQLVPSMPVRIAIKESSGTDTYQRDKIDWVALADQLAGKVSNGIVVLIPTFDIVSGFGAIFMLAGPTADPFTGVVGTGATG